MQGKFCFTCLTSIKISLLIVNLEVKLYRISCHIKKILGLIILINVRVYVFHYVTALGLTGDLSTGILSNEEQP